jgi:peroxiredoxin Q/BCP
MRVPLLLAVALTVACTSPPPPSASTPPNTTGDYARNPASLPAPITPGIVPPAGAAIPAYAAPSPSDFPAQLAPGEPAPDFTTKDMNGNVVHLANLKGHYVVVYFYPKDETPGCTTEACSFRDAWKALSDRGVIIIGVSLDDEESHRAFAKNHQLPFTLVSDPKGEIAAKYGVPLVEHNGQKYTKRQSFVVGPDGKLKKIYREVDVTVHAQEIAKDTAG